MHAYENSLRSMIGLLAFVVWSVLSGCSSTPLGADIQSGAAAYAVMDTSKAQTPGSDYKIGEMDMIDVYVFQEPELSAKQVEVDASGSVSLPLVGSVKALDKTTSQLSNEIATRLARNYLKNPQVTVTVASSASQKVTVGGEVREPGVYDIKGGTTLLQAVALAKGASTTAALDQIVVFRNVNGQRMGAVFDIKAIGAGRAADPPILGNDIVVVGFSKARSLWRDILSTVPVLNVFRPLAL